MDSEPEVTETETRCDLRYMRTCHIHHITANTDRTERLETDSNIPPWDSHFGIWLAIVLHKMEFIDSPLTEFDKSSNGLLR